MTTATIQRFARGARTTHWLIGGSGLLLLISGLVHLPPVHLPMAALFISSILVHSITNLVRRDFSLIPGRGDLGASLQTLQAMTGKAAEPRHGKFLAEQRLAHTLISIAALLLIMSGIMLFVGKVADLSSDLGSIVLAGWMHIIAALTFALWTVLHIGALLLRPNRPLLGSMFSGSVERAYADARHPDWAYSEKQEQANKTPSRF